VVSQFLADAHPSHLLPPSSSAKGALTRARINFFVDTWFSKVGSHWFQILRKDSVEEKEALAKEFLSIVEKEIEPLLKDAAPFFGGSEKLTLAEVVDPADHTAGNIFADTIQALTAPFILRIYALGKSKEQLLPRSLISGLDGLPNFTKWVTEVVKQDSVTYIWDEDAVVQGTAKRMEKMKAQGK
jgi:glutathione S-transferase